MATTRIFIHGLESSSQGAKARFFTEKFPDILIPDFTGPLSARMTKLKKILHGKSKVILIASSFGGLMASLYALENEPRIRKIILLAPALSFDPSLSTSDQIIKVSTWLYIGKKDEVTPPILVEPVAQAIFSILHYHLVDDDHLLNDTFPSLDWARLLNFISRNV